MHKQLKRSSDCRRTYRWLRDMLVNYGFRPHQPLNIGQLAECLKTSATPVREALIRLHAEGLVGFEGGRGFFAKVLTARDMVALHKLLIGLLRIPLEAHVAVGDLSSIKLDADTEAAGDRNACADHLECFYESLVSLSRNDVLLDILRNINARTHYVRAIELEAPDRRRDAVAAMTEVKAALEGRNVPAAMRVFERELATTVALMPELVKEGVSRCCAKEGLPLRPNETDPARSNATRAQTSRPLPHGQAAR